MRRLTNGFGVHACIVTAGSEGAYGQGFKVIRNLGTLVCVGLPRLDFDLPISPFMMVVRGMLLYFLPRSGAANVPGVFLILLR